MRRQPVQNKVLGAFPCLQKNISPIRFFSSTGYLTVTSSHGGFSEQWRNGGDSSVRFLKVSSFSVSYFSWKVERAQVQLDRAVKENVEETPMLRVVGFSESIRCMRLTLWLEVRLMCVTDIFVSHKDPETPRAIQGRAH